MVRRPAEYVPSVRESPVSRSSTTDSGPAGRPEAGHGHGGRRPITPPETPHFPLSKIKVQGRTPRRQVVRVHRGPPNWSY